jgi:hypothetical protein
MTLKECYEVAGRRFPFTVDRHFAHSKAVIRGRIIVSLLNSDDVFMSSDGLACAGWGKDYTLVGPAPLVQAARLADKVERLVCRCDFHTVLLPLGCQCGASAAEKAAREGRAA